VNDSGNARPLTFTDFTGNGLSSPFDTGAACGAGGCAFPGINPNAGQFFMLFPIGRSVYNGLQMKLTQNVNRPMPGVRALNFQISYALSRFENSGAATVSGTQADADQDFIVQAADNNNPNKFFGPSLLDRTHQISFGGYADIPGGFRLGLTSHFYSPLSSGVFVPQTFNGGEIFTTDFNGDGTIQDPVPGTHMGNFDRGISASSLNNVINNYNSTVAGQPTPAGQVLINNGLFTLAQLQQLGGVAPSLPLAPKGQVDFPWLKGLDFKLAWRHTFKERVTIEPNVAFYNVFNFANFNLPPNVMSGIIDGSNGTLNGTTYADLFPFRVGNGTGVYSQGAPRQIEFGLRLTF